MVWRGKRALDLGERDRGKAAVEIHVAAGPGTLPRYSRPSAARQRGPAEDGLPAPFRLGVVFWVVLRLVVALR